MNKLRFFFQVLLYLPWSIYFCIRCLPFKQAMKLPVLLYKPKLRLDGGRVRIVGDIFPGMIRMGFPYVSIYPSSGIRIENHGSIVFNGSCHIGNGSAISTGKEGQIYFGNNFGATAAVKLICYDSITFGNDTLIGWESIICDSDLHEYETSAGVSQLTAPIVIGNNNWFAMQCIALKGSRTEDDCIFAARSLVNRDLTEYGNAVMFAGTPARPVRKGVRRILENHSN